MQWSLAKMVGHKVLAAIEGVCFKIILMCIMKLHGVLSLGPGVGMGALITQ